MLVAGVQLSASAAALLALLLHRSQHAALAQRIGIAVDTNSAGVGLNDEERDVILDVLEDPPEELSELRRALQRQRAARRSRVTDSGARMSGRTPRPAGRLGHLRGT
jgi:hypothetical protein